MTGAIEFIKHARKVCENQTKRNSTNSRKSIQGAERGRRMTREERTALIMHLKYCQSIGADYVLTEADVDEIIEALEQRTKGKWIPVSERLPERNKDVLVWARSTARGGDICLVGCCDNGAWFLQSSAGTLRYPSQYKVVAWQLLPEPYKAESEVKE